MASSASSSPGGVMLQGRFTGEPATPITIVGASGVSEIIKNIYYKYIVTLNFSIRQLRYLLTQYDYSIERMSASIIQ